MSDQVDYDAVRAASAAAWAEKKSDGEKARRLARYDEAIRLLRLTQTLDGISFEDEDKIEAFLDAEPKEAEKVKP